MMCVQGHGLLSVLFDCVCMRCVDELQDCRLHVYMSAATGQNLYTSTEIPATLRASHIFRALTTTGAHAFKCEDPQVYKTKKISPTTVPISLCIRYCARSHHRAGAHTTMASCVFARVCQSNMRQSCVLYYCVAGMPQRQSLTPYGEDCVEYPVRAIAISALSLSQI
jgi:hypothetical protein